MVPPEILPIEGVVQAAEKDISRAAASIPAAQPARRVLTFRAFIWAVLLSGGAAVLCHWHDGHVLGSSNESFIRSSATMHNYFAPLAVGLIFFFLLLANTLLFRIRRSWALGTGELALVMGLSLLACPIPRYIAQPQIGQIGYTPALMAERRPIVADMQKANPLAFLPENAFLTLEDSRVFDGTLPGHVSPGLVNLFSIPWHAWWNPAIFWAPLLLAFLVFSISLGYMLYNQWAHRELLPFPLAEFAASLVTRRQERALPDIFYNSLFWVGLVLVLIIFSTRGLADYVLDMVKIPTKFDQTVLSGRIPFLNDSREGYSLLRGTVYFAVVAVAYLLPSEISLTAWFSWPLMVIATYLFYTRTGERFSDGHNTMMLIGCWWGMAILIIYAGRAYFRSLFAAALGIGKGAGLDRQSVWVARLFLVALAALLTLLISVYDMPADIAVLWTLFMTIFLLVLCRLVTAMGIDWIGISSLGPLGVLTSFLGISGMGARVYSQVATYERFLMPKNGLTVLPFTPAVANAAHVESRLTGRNDSYKIVIPFLLIMLAISIVTVLWMGYSYEGKSDDLGPPCVLENANSLQGYIRKAADTPETMRAAMTERLSFSARWKAMAMPKEFPALCAVGLGVVLAVGFLQIRLPRFPFHPLPLVLLGTWVMSRYWWSFLIGWAIKRTVLKIGGYKLFDQMRPLFTGMIVGLAVTATLWAIIHCLVYQYAQVASTRDWGVFLFDMFSGD